MATKRGQEDPEWQKKALAATKRGQEKLRALRTELEMPAKTHSHAMAIHRKLQAAKKAWDKLVLPPHTRRKRN